MRPTRYPEPASKARIKGAERAEGGLPYRPVYPPCRPWAVVMIHVKTINLKTPPGRVREVDATELVGRGRDPATPENAFHWAPQAPGAAFFTQGGRRGIYIWIFAVHIAHTLISNNN